MHQFEWLSEKEGNFLNFLQKEGGYPKRGDFLRKGGVPTLEETMNVQESFLLELKVLNFDSPWLLICTTHNGISLFLL